MLLLALRIRPSASARWERRAVTAGSPCTCEANVQGRSIARHPALDTAPDSLSRAT